MEVLPFAVFTIYIKRHGDLTVYTNVYREWLSAVIASGPAESLTYIRLHIKHQRVDLSPWTPRCVRVNEAAC